MVTLSQRAEFPLQRTFAVGQAITAWQAANPGKTVIGFTWGDTPYGASDRIMRAASRAVIKRQTIDGNLHKYPPVAGEARLLPLVVEDFERFGVAPLDPATQVMITNGAMEGVSLASDALLDPGDEAIIPGPYYHPLPAMVMSPGGKMRIVLASPENGFKITPEQLFAAISDRSKVIYLTNPTNPVGECYSKYELRAIAKVLLPYQNISIIVDEIYERLVFDGTHTSFWTAAPELRDRMVVSTSLSKNAGLSGLRIGWAGGAATIITGMKKCKIQKNWGTNTLGQEALYAALSKPKKFEAEVRTVRERLMAGRDLLSARLRAMGFDFVGAKAGMFLFPKVPDGLNLPFIGDDRSMSLGERFAMALIPYGLSVAPGIDMGIEDRFRIAFSLTEDDIRLGMDRMEQALEGLRS